MGKHTAKQKYTEKRSAAPFSILDKITLCCELFNESRKIKFPCISCNIAVVPWDEMIYPKHYRMMYIR